MKIIGFSAAQEIRTGGHKRYIELISDIAKKENEVVLFGTKKFKINNKNVVVRILPNVNKSFFSSTSMFYKKYLDKTLIRNTADWIIIFGETSFYGSLAIKQKTGAKLLIALRSNFVEEEILSIKYSLNLLDKLKSVILLVKSLILEKRISKKADLIVFQTVHDLEAFCKRNPKSTNVCKIIPNHIGASWMNREYENSNSSTEIQNILYVGSLGFRKGIMILLKTFNLLCKKYNNIKLTVIGDGPYKKKVKKYIFNHNLQENVKLLGKVSNPLEEMSKHDLLVLPSLYDSYPNVALEALLVGIPIVGTSVSGFKAILNETKYMCKPGSVKSMYEMLRKILSNQLEYEALKKVMQKCKAKHEFDWSEKFLELIKNY
ncbi:glycosyltransferase family 4 protein [Spirochaeta cellobiosiphila]|uniref:glycosyltransferase family 4 protein n=1 Tax=Spirochaeta cellobiosiphila TaxID=504483 RepID=UPI0004053BBD|nr:glycosyltransferase family 4 protein [Spirochaeta cellobiosiphila]